jgi:hypothetical protein
MKTFLTILLSYIAISLFANIDNRNVIRKIETKFIEHNSQFNFDSIIIGGSIWSTSDTNEIFNLDKNGGTNVIVNLLNENGAVITTDTTNINSEYEFKKVEKAKYKIELDPINFQPGYPLYGLEACSSIGKLDDVNIDHDNHLESNIFTSLLLDFNLSTGPNFAINTTIDFCLKSDCNTPNPIASHSPSQFIDTINQISLMNIFCSTILKNNDFSGEYFCNTIPNKNADWFSFIAPNENYNIDIVLYGCAEGNNSGRITILNENNEVVLCEEKCMTGVRVIPSTLFNPLSLYKLGIAGCEESICSYSINIKNTSIISALLVDHTTSQNLSITPNPSLNAPIDIKANFKIKNANLYTSNGMIVKDSFDKIDDHNIQLKELKPGLYIINVSSTDKNFVRKIAVY